MSVNGSNNFLNIEDANLRVRNGSVHAQGMTIGGAIVSASHGLQSVSDTSNTTSNTLQFTNATTAFKATSNIELTSASKIIVDSNVVTEYTGPHDRPLRKYPEVALTQNDESATSGYVAIGSSNGSGSYPEYTAFDGVVTNSTTGWASDGTYASGTGISTFSWNGSFGEYLSLELPKALRLQKMFLKGYEHSGIDYQNAPRDIKLYGSNNETNWVLLKTETDLPIDSITNNSTYININATEHYKYIRLQITKTYRRTAAYTRIGELEYYGHEEGSGSLDTTLKTVYNVPATTGTQLEVYYDAKGESTVQSPIPDFSPNTNTGAVVGHSPTLDETDGIESFKFNGSSQYVTGTHGLTTGSDPVHTISLWFKRIAKVGQFEYLVQLGQGGTSHQQSAIFLHDDKIAHGHWGGGVYHTDVITDNVWYHIAATFTGGNTSDLSTHKIFVNGVEIGIDAYSSDGPLVLTGTALTLGRKEHAGGTPGDYFNGSIANFRLYSKALNADQVKELYDYQKDYFLGSKSQVTLYKGHLGVGVTEPSGQLELAGDERIQEYPPGPMDDYETLIPGHGAFVTHGGSSGSAYAPWRAFNKELGSAGNFWIDTGIGYSHTAPYEALSTHSRTTLHDGSVLLGGWIDLVCPYPIKLSSVSIAPRTNYWQISLQRGVILGSNNGEDWYQIDTIDYNSPSGSTGTTAISNELTNFSLVSTSYYSHIRLVCTHLTSQYGSSPSYDMHWQMGALVYFGTPGPTTLDKGSLTLGRSLDVPRVSRYDVHTETPRPEKLLVDFDTTVNNSPTDISGQGNHGFFGGSSYYSSADKAFILANNPAAVSLASTHYIRAELNNSETGNQYHSVSLWFKVLSGQNSSWRTIFECGENPRSGNADISLYVPGGDDKLVFAHGGSSMYTDTLTNLYFRWHHVVLTYDGANRKIYLDGALIKTQATTTWVGVANMTLHFGRNNHSNANEGCDCHVSNFKLYWKTALEPSEVQKLYRLGRTGRSMVISDTAVGIGKAPEAQLDVRGNLNVDGVITNQKPAFYAELSNASSRSIGPGVAVFNDAKYNRGGCYNASTGLFTAPITGAYKFHCYGYGRSSSQPFWVRPWLNGSYWARGPYGVYSSAGEWIVPMNAGDTLGMYLPSSNYAFYVGGDRHNGFSGYLVG